MFEALLKDHRIWPLLLFVICPAIYGDPVPTAQPDSAFASGFSPGQLFQHFTELDNVNAFNGNLFILLPIGREYAVEGGLSGSEDTRFREAVFRDFDGFGNFRRVVSRGNFVANDLNRVMEMNYNPGRGSWPNQSMIAPSDPWLLGLRDEEKVTEGAETNVVQLCKNATTGFLESRRILSGTARGRDDLLSAFEPDAAGNGCLDFPQINALGNPRSQRILGSSQFNLDFVFDKAGRVVRVDAGGRPLKEFFYARGNRSATDKTAGKLVMAKRHNYLVDPATGEEIDVILSERTTYAGRGGRISKRLTSANRSFLQQSSVAFETSFFYDLLGNPDTLIYPRCLHACSAPPRTIFMDYLRGRLTGVTGYASSIGYHPNAMMEMS